MEKDRKAEQPKTAKKPIFYENPYDIETFFVPYSVMLTSELPSDANCDKLNSLPIF